MYAIVGATGNTGSVIADRLLASGKKVRVIGRSRERLDRLVQRGAEAFVGDVTDAAAMTRAFSGAQAVFAMVPPDMATDDLRSYQDRATDSLAAAIKTTRVTHAVCLSSIGADKSERTGPVLGLHGLERKISTISGLHVLFLRPASFMENHFMQINLIQSMGTMGGVLKADLPMPQIATRDIAAVAADALAQHSFTGKSTRELLGQRDVTPREAAAILGVAIGNPKLGYSHFPAFMVEMAMKQTGMPAATAKLIIEMNEAMNDGWLVPLEARTPENTTPTSMETFAAEEFAPRYQGKAASA